MRFSVAVGVVVVVTVVTVRCPLSLEDQQQLFFIRLIKSLAELDT